MKNMNNLINLSKTSLLIPLFVLTLHSCDDSETGIVKDKIDGKVYLTTVNDTNNVYRVINFDRAYKDYTTKNLYLNMNKGDTVVYCNHARRTEIIPSERNSSLFGGGTYYKIKSINGVGRYDLPNLVRKKEEETAIKQLQEEYKKAKQR